MIMMILVIKITQMIIKNRNLFNFRVKMEEDHIEKG